MEPNNNNNKNPNHALYIFNPNHEPSIGIGTGTGTGTGTISSQQRRQKPAMEKLLLDAFLIKLAKSNPDTPLTIEGKNHIEQRLLQLIPDLHTPSHPPYASMIHRAIVELNEKRGSSEESISMFIKKEYDDLPWAHASYLSHHLEKLRQKGDIYVARNRCYKLNLHPKVRVQKRKRGRGRHGTETLVEEESQSHEQQSDVNEENRPKNQQILLRIVRKQNGDTEVDKDQGGSKWARIELVEEQEQSHDRHGQMVEIKSPKWGEVAVFDEQQHESVIKQNQGEEKKHWQHEGKMIVVCGLQAEKKCQQHVTICNQLKPLPLLPASTTASSDLPTDQKQLVRDHELLVNPKRPPDLECPTLLKSSRKQRKQAKLCGVQVSESHAAITETPLNSVVSSVLCRKPYELRSRSSGRPIDIKLMEVKESSKEQEQQAKCSAPVAQQETITMFLDTPIDLQEVIQDKQPIDLELTAVEHSSQIQLERQQPRKLRQGGDKMSDPKPATVTSVGEIWPIQHEHQLFLPSNLESSMEIKATSMEETSQSIEQQPKTRGQRKQFNSRPQGSSLAPEQSELPLQQEFSNEERPLELEWKKAEKSYEAAAQQRQDNLQRRKLRPRGQGPSQTEAATATVIEPSLPSQCQVLKIKATFMAETSQSTEQQPKTRGQRKQFNSRPQGSSLAPKHSELPLQQEFSNEESPLELEWNKAEKSYEAAAQQRQDNLQRRKLRPRGQGPSQPEASTATVMEPSLPSQCQVMEIKAASMEETSQSTEQQPKTRGQRKQFNSRPQSSSLAPQQSELPLQQEFLNEERPLELEWKKAEKSYEAAAQQRQDNLQRRKLRPRGQGPSQPEAATATVMEPSFPSQCQVLEIKATSMEETSQSTEQQPKTRGHRKQFNSWPLSSSLAPQLSELPLQQEFSNEERPLELEWKKAEKSFEAVAQQRQENLQRRKLRPRGQGPLQLEVATATVMEPSLPSQCQVLGQGQRRHPRLIETTVTVHAELLPSQQKEYHNKPKQKRRGPLGRPPKAKPDAGTTKGDVLHREKRKRRGRPPKYKPDEDTLIKDLLTSQNRR